MHLILLLPFLAFGHYSNSHLTVSTHTLAHSTHKKQPSALSVVHISDLHNKNFGYRQSRLLNKIKSLRPDLILITGDLIDHAPHRHAVVFLQQACRICPVYLVRGNHEYIAGNDAVLEKKLSACGVHILKNNSADFKKDGYTYRITGLDDPAFYHKDHNYFFFIKNRLDKITAQQKNAAADYEILLSHRPELFDLYSNYPFDLVLCGHAHGGQFRPPFTDGLYAPNQGIFPKYTSGAHTKNNTTEIISRGLGNSSFPLRLFNFPEIVHIIIKQTCS